MNESHWERKRTHSRVSTILAYRKSCIALAFLAVLSILAIFIALLIDFKSANKVTADSYDDVAKKLDENCYIATYKADVPITSMTFNKTLGEKNSDEFNRLAKDFCKSLNENMEELYECGEKVESCRVDGFTNGSVVVNTIIRHTKIGKKDSVTEEKVKEETTRILNVVKVSISKASAGGNSDNLFKKEQVELEKVDVKENGKVAYVQCPPVETPKRSDIVTLNLYANYVGDIVTVQCDEGTYFPDDTTVKSITCLEKGQWSDELYDCEPKLCRDLDPTLLQNSKVLHGTPEGNRYRDTVAIKCDDGFTFDLSQSCDNVRIAFCGADGRWDEEITEGCKDFDECSSNPCFNDGTCTDGVGNFSCECTDGFTGSQCEIDVDDCEGITCENGGTCFDRINSFTCVCVAGYDGDRCDDDVDECLSTPCINGGSCVDDVNQYNCTCPVGVAGEQCEIDIVDDCLSDPCQNGGTCVDGINEYTCNCITGSSGVVCEIDNVNECVGSPCAESPCGEEGGTCTNVFFECRCLFENEEFNPCDECLRK